MPESKHLISVFIRQKLRGIKKDPQYREERKKGLKYMEMEAGIELEGETETKRETERE